MSLVLNNSRINYFETKEHAQTKLVYIFTNTKNIGPIKCVIKKPSKNYLQEDFTCYKLEMCVIVGTFIYSRDDSRSRRLWNEEPL